MKNENKEKDSPKSASTADGTTKSISQTSSQQSNRRITRSNAQLPLPNHPSSMGSRIVRLPLRPELLAKFPCGKTTLIVQPSSLQKHDQSTAEPEEIINKSTVYYQKTFSVNDIKKHTPIGYRGQRFLLEDNPNLDRGHVKRGEIEKEKLEFMVKDTKGNFQHRFFRDRAANKWDDVNWIAEVNKWRNQAFRRMFKHDNAFEGRTCRAKWGLRETISLKYEVGKIMKQTGRMLTLKEWETVATFHNEEYAGTNINVGERLIGGGQAKSTQMIEKRSVNGIKALFLRTASLKTFINSLVLEPADGGVAAGTKAIATANAIGAFDTEKKIEDMDKEMPDSSGGIYLNGGDDINEMEGVQRWGGLDQAGGAF